MTVGEIIASQIKIFFVISQIFWRFVIDRHLVPPQTERPRHVLVLKMNDRLWRCYGTTTLRRIPDGKKKKSGGEAVPSPTKGEHS